MTTEERLTKIAENEQKVFDAGKEKYKKDWWQMFQNNGSRNHYVSAFQYSFWGDKIYAPQYPIIAQTYGLQNTYNNSSVTDTKVPITVYGSMNGSFTNSKIVTINKLILNNVTSVSNPFGGCTGLKNIVVEGEWKVSISFAVCPLSAESIVSIIEHLSDTAADQTLTLKQTAVDAMVFPLTSAQSGITYNSRDELINTKTNWTISLI